MALEYCETCQKELTEQDRIDGFCSACGAAVTFLADMTGLELWSGLG